MANIINHDIGQAFSGKASGKFIPGWDAPLPHTPDNDPSFVFPIWVSDIMVWLLHSKDPLYIFGPTGCGKTATVKQLVRKINYPVYEITGHNRLEFPELVGHHTVQQGSMHFEYGPLAMAMKNGGLFLLNEIDLLDPSTAAGLNSVLDGAPLTVPENGGEIIKPHPLFRFVATANSNGAGDETGFYQGILRQNIAFMDRYTLVKATYLDPAQEKQIVKTAAPSLPDDVVNKMVKFAGAVRNLFLGEDTGEGDKQINMELTLSTRTIIRWALLTERYEPLKERGVNVIEYAFDRALGYRASGTTRQSLAELMQRLFG